MTPYRKLPAANSAFETEGTVTNSERRVQRVRKALDPPGDAKDDIWILAELASVIDAVDDFYRRHNANVSRAVHTLGTEATEAYEAARSKLASGSRTGS